MVEHGAHRKLLVGIHPRTGEALPPPMRLEGTAWEPGVGKYPNLETSAAEMSMTSFTVIALKRFDRFGENGKLRDGASQDASKA